MANEYMNTKQEIVVLITNIEDASNILINYNKQYKTLQTTKNELKFHFPSLDFVFSLDLLLLSLALIPAIKLSVVYLLQTSMIFLNFFYFFVNHLTFN